VVQNKKSTFGLEKNIALALCYAGLWITGLIFFLSEKEDKEIRFSAMQSIIFFGVVTVLGVVPLVGWILSPLLALIAFIVWILMVVKSYQGKVFELPVIGQYARKYSK
jgi:uncharacterized membrane protein